MSTLDRYLGLLGQPATPPTLESLTALVRAQLERVPFENISKLLLKKRGATYIPSLDEHLDGIERHNFGGTCYANNPHFFSLLEHLGYEVTLCGAAMSQPDVHIVSIVRLHGCEYLIDVGYAAPFFEPLPRDRGHEIRFGTCTYRFEPCDDRGRSRLTMTRDGQRVHGYLVDPTPRPLSHFREVIEDSYRGHATFMNAVVIERFRPGGSVRIHNLTVTEIDGNRVTRSALADRDELVVAIEKHAGMPADLVREAIDGVSLEGDIYT